MHATIPTWTFIAKYTQNTFRMYALHGYAWRLGPHSHVATPPFSDVIRWPRYPRRRWFRSFLRRPCRHVSSHGRSERPRQLPDRRANGAPHALHRVAGASVLRRLSLGPLRHPAQRATPSAIRSEQILVPLAVRSIRAQPGARTLG